MSDSDFNWTDSGTDVDLEISDEGLDPSLTTRRGRGRRSNDIDPDVLVLISKAKYAYGVGNHEEAIALAQEAVEIDPYAIDSYKILGDVYDDLHDPERALTARYLAASLNKSSIEDWQDIADRALELGHLHHAADYLKHVSRLARDDWEVVYRRAEIHLELRQPTKALTLLQRIRRKFFSRGDLDEKMKTQVLLDLARVYESLGRTQDILEIYMGIYDGSVNRKTNMDPAPEVELNWQNLNVLGELLFNKGSYARAIKLIKNGSRWILGRQEETWWADAIDDSEFDDRRFSKLQKSDRGDIPFQDPSKYLLPMDIRVWLLVARLKQYPQNSTALDDALVHYEHLQRAEPVADYADLYTRAADGFYQARLYPQALDIYSLLTNVPYSDADEYLLMMGNVARTHLEMGQLKEAEQVYDLITKRQDDNVEALVALGEIYQATGRPQTANVLIERAYDIRSRIKAREEREAALSRADTPDIPIEDIQPSDPFLNRAAQRVSATNRQTPMEKADRERRRQARAGTAYSELDRFQSGLNQGNIVAAREWIRASQDLLDMFAENRKFFPSDRSKVYSLEQRSNSIHGDGGNIDSRLRNIQRLSTDADDAEDDQLPIHKFLGRPFNFWFTLFMESALTQARYGQASGAYTAVRTARTANVFYSDPHQEQTMRLVELACTALADDPQAASESLRHMYMSHQFSVDVLRFYGTLLASGRRVMAIFGSSNNQKFFLRQIKAMDSIVQNRDITGAARVNIEDKELSINPVVEDNPLLLVIYGYIMLMGPSYVPALTYLLRALESIPQNPVVLLTIAIVYVQRAIQRVSTNRHLQILQGLTFMQHYMATRQSSAPEKQEAEYNMGRLFHGLGLFQLAIPHYERVLKFGGDVPEDYDLAREAAYNLYLIYATVGNFRLSKEIVDNYLTL